MKTWKDHYKEFRQYCRTLTDTQLANVLRDEQERRSLYPEDEVFDACYEAAETETSYRNHRE